MKRKRSSSRQKRIRRLVLNYWWVERGQRRCCYCSKQLHFTPNHRQQASVEHIIPLSNGGKDSLQNILLSCTACNQKRGNKNFLQFIKGLPKEDWLAKKYKEAAA